MRPILPTLWLAASASALLAACVSPAEHPILPDDAGSPGKPNPNPNPNPVPSPGLSGDLGAPSDLQPPVSVDDAMIVSSSLPTTIPFAGSATAQVVVKNTGTTTWTRADGYKLGAVGDSDPFAASRVELPDGVAVAPGAQATFQIALNAPAQAGPQVSDWRMVREHVRWFGATTTQTITVAAFDLSQAQIFNSPADIASWPETAKITKLDFGDGIFVDFTKRASTCNPAGPAGVWPDVTFGDGGSLEYTIWMVEQIDGKWYASGGIEYWCDDHYVLRNGGMPSGFGHNWFYDPGRWQVMANRQPAVGEWVGFFVSAGDARNNGATVIKERSNVVFVPFPSDTPSVLNF
jgi:hypothetical protein